MLALQVLRTSCCRGDRAVPEHRGQAGVDSKQGIDRLSPNGTGSGSGTAEAVWYTYVDEHDLNEIIEEHLKHGRIVERLKI